MYRQKRTIFRVNLLIRNGMKQVNAGRPAQAVDDKRSDGTG